jgi:hypothetical protein
MPSRIRIGGYKFRFYSNENQEPPHVHVISAEKSVKVWIRTLKFKRNGFNVRELNSILKLVEDNREQLLEAWNEHFKIG